MKWIEVIHMQVSDANREALERDLFSLLSSAGRRRGLRSIKTYRSAVTEGDWLIRLQWATQKAEPQGSEICRCLMHVLGAFGLVSHSVWVEAQENGRLPGPARTGGRH